MSKKETCPNCGYCPHCGRSAAPMYPVYPWWTYPQPTWIGVDPWWGTTGTVTIGPTVTTGSTVAFDPNTHISWTGGQA